MLNNYVCVGRLVSEPEIKETKNDRKEILITLAIQRTFKNLDGNYDTDFVTFRLFGAIGNNTKEYCHKGDIIGVKGRIQTYKVDDENRIELVAEKVTFLSSKKED